MGRGTLPQARANGLELEYDARGEGSPVLLIMGLGCQMTFWDGELCDLIAARGHRVIRFDNRDIGLSSKLDHLGVPDLRRLMVPTYLRMKVGVPYTLEDMADDAIGLLDALDVPAAHVVGASMGGMIAQLMAIRNPDRVLSLTSVMSTTGRRRHLVLDPRVLRYLVAKVPPRREAIIEHGVKTFRAISGSGFPFEEDRWRAKMAQNFDRCFHPPGFPRQFMAVLSARDRVPALRRLRVPTLVVHGSEDPLVFPRAGRETARAIPGAKLHIVRGMGHALPIKAWPELVDVMTAHFATAAS
jgi:pimeloyl-ACP methyl ester carboxylesterase